MKLVFLGPPGAGKGTIAGKLAKAMEIPHISTGDIFRSNIKNQTELGKKVKAILDSGELVPDDLTIELVKDRLNKSDAAKGFILDGFPRTVPQADALEKICIIDSVVNFVLHDEQVVRRLSGRRVHPSSGRIYHIDFHPPKVAEKDDITGEDLVQREDDRKESIANRLRVYREQTEPLISYYREKGTLRDLDAAPDPDTVYEDLRSALQG